MSARGISPEARAPTSSIRLKAFPTSTGTRAASAALPTAPMNMMIRMRQ
jgi:hypothetical protein